jgi:hypothetical protein
VNLRRKALDTLAPKEVKDMLSILDGKKTLIGIIVSELPTIIESVGKILAGTGADTTDYVKVTGALLAVVGMVHKFLKD